MQVYVILNHHGDYNENYIESIWASKELAEEELERLKKEMQPYQRFSIAQETVYGYRGY